jgi:cytochrome P450
MPTTVFASLDANAMSGLTGLSDEVPGILDIMHQSIFLEFGRKLSGLNMMHCTIPMSKRLYANLQSLAEPQDEITLSLPDYMFSTLYRACAHALFGESCMPDTMADFHTMDDGVYYILSALPMFVKTSVQSQSRLFAALKAYAQEALDQPSAIRGASPMILDYIRLLRDGGYSTDVIGRALAHIMWGAQSNLMATAVSALGYVVETPGLYDALASKMRAAVAVHFSDMDALFACEPTALSGPAFAVLDSIFYETLRLDSVAVIVRSVNEDTSLRAEDDLTHHFAKDELLFVDVRGLHYDSAIFAKPTEFVHDRFVDPETGTLQQARLVRTFGGGKLVVSRSFGLSAVDPC